jgi:hypothetical protein
MVVLHVIVKFGLGLDLVREATRELKNLVYGF